MKKAQSTAIILVIILIIAVLAAGAVLIYFNLNKQGPIVGNDRDSHGCIPSAGYTWCEEKQKCLRVWEENCTQTNPVCDYNWTGRTYINKNSNCIINFICTIDKKAFKDECGCGCEILNSNQNTTETKIFCKPEERGAEVCSTIYGPVCGWFNSSIKCLKYPCAQEFSNSCFACSNPTVEYYTNGECPV